MADPTSVTEYRLGEMEKGLRDLRGDVKEAIGTLGGGMTALQTQLTTYQSSMADKYALRRDLEEVKADVQHLSDRAWVLGVALIGSATGIVIAIISWFKPGH